jgi:hypothetical protein
VYTESVVPCALDLVDPVRYRERIRYSFRFLARAQTASGAWSYTDSGGRTDNSNTQFAVLGLAAAERSGVLDNHADRVLYERARTHALLYWKGEQRADGGWSYRSKKGESYLSMTSAGIASLHLLGERMERPTRTCGTYTYDSCMKMGLKRIARHLETFYTDQHKKFSYTLYSLERVGVLLGLRTIGGHDWYRMGAAAVLGRARAPNRYPSWHNYADATLDLLFLAKGNLPVAIAKWRWSGDWNNDHGDVAAWVDIAGRALGKKLDWWECDLDEPGSPAAKASLIFVNGHRKFVASDGEIAFLRQFLLNRGTVVAEACCGTRTFFDSFARTMCKRLFPGQPAEFVPLNGSHPVCSIVHRLNPDDIRGFAFKSNCRRPKLVLIERDFSCALNGESTGQAEITRARKVSTNLLAWAMQTRKPKGKLNSSTLEDGPPELLTVDQALARSKAVARMHSLAMGRLVHRGEWDVDKSFFAELRKELAADPRMPEFDAEVPIAPTSRDLFGIPFLFLSGHEQPALKEEEYLPLRQYLQNGGFLFVSNCCTTDVFDKGVRQLLRQVLPNDRLEEIPKTDPVWTNRLAGGPLATKAYGDRFGKEWAPLYGIRRRGRWIVIYTAVDACCSLEGDMMEGIPAFKRESSVPLIVNIMHRAFSP